MGIWKSGLSERSVWKEAFRRSPQSRYQKDLLQRLRQSVLYTDRNQEILPVLSVRQPWLSKGTEMAACAGTKRSHLQNLWQHFYANTVGCQVLLQCLPTESLQGECYGYRKVSTWHLSVSVTKIRKVLQISQVVTLTTCNNRNKYSVTVRQVPKSGTYNNRNDVKLPKGDEPHESAL